MLSIVHGGQLFAARRLARALGIELQEVAFREGRPHSVDLEAQIKALQSEQASTAGAAGRKPERASKRAPEQASNRAPEQATGHQWRESMPSRPKEHGKARLAERKW